MLREAELRFTSLLPTPGYCDVTSSVKMVSCDQIFKAYSEGCTLTVHFELISYTLLRIRAVKDESEEENEI